MLCQVLGQFIEFDVFEIGEKVWGESPLKNGNALKLNQRSRVARGFELLHVPVSCWVNSPEFVPIIKIDHTLGPDREFSRIGNLEVKFLHLLKLVSEYQSSLWVGVRVDDVSVSVNETHWLVDSVVLFFRIELVLVLQFLDWEVSYLNSLLVLFAQTHVLFAVDQSGFESSHKCQRLIVVSPFLALKEKTTHRVSSWSFLVKGLRIGSRHRTDQ